MVANRRRDTRAEVEIRQSLHAAGLRYRVDVPLPFDRRRRADIVFSKVGLYVFIDGCFWHACPQHYVAPRTHPEYWRAKVRDNVIRDTDTTTRLTEAGFDVLRFWEHVLPGSAAADIHERYLQLRFGAVPPSASEIDRDGPSGLRPSIRERLTVVPDSPGSSSDQDCRS
jgi:DNA mismatch endonuclease, patch repair protein